MPRPEWFGRREYLLTVEALANGATLRDVARELGRGYKCVAKAAKRNGVSARRGGRRLAETVDYRLRVMTEFARGARTVSDVARRTGFDRNHLSSVVAELERAGALLRTGRTRGARVEPAGDWGRP